MVSTVATVAHGAPRLGRGGFPQRSGALALFGDYRYKGGFLERPLASAAGGYHHPPAALGRATFMSSP